MFAPTFDTVYSLAAQLLADYARHLDARSMTEWPALFTENGALQIGAGRRVEGRAELADFAAHAPHGVHVPGLPSIEFDGDVVRAHSALIFLDAETGETRAVVNHDQLVWVEDDLRILERRLEIVADSAFARER